MTILQSTALLVEQKQGAEFEKLTIDRLAAGGSGYHFFDKLAPRVVIEKPS